MLCGNFVDIEEREEIFIPFLLHCVLFFDICACVVLF